ncbi:MAG: CBS domain-containing protein [Sedimentisphaerales bacterium]|jgi:CBS domain-containing protein|nr:CBS domain-containing protein [Sedimentisphaerales bacterium]NLT76161.1 CBS domain-containing protein [Planctomycetota bacterium]
MAATATDIESRLAELSDASFEAFCEDLGAMFDADVQCTRQQAGAGTVEEVRKHFKKLAAVHLVQATGALNGTFQLFFDQGGLFILSGFVVMLPEKKILDDVKRGSIDDADNLTDAAREVGNLLVGSWDRVFREDCKGHEHFLKTNTFIGKPWEDPSKIELVADEAVHFAVYEMKVASYPSFCCAAVFPKKAIHPAENAVAADAPGQASAADPSPAEGATPVSAEPTAEPTAAAEPSPQETPTAVAESDRGKAGPATADVATDPQAKTCAAPAKEAPVQTEASDSEGLTAIPEDIQSIVETVVGSSHASTPPEERKVPPRPPVNAALAEASPSILDQVLADYTVGPDTSALTDLLNLPARKIMTSEVIWCDPEATVQDVIELMQQHSTGYVLVGRDGVLEGLLSSSTIQGAISPYLRPVFAKWRRPEDDATLGIKVKWIMSRPVRTIKPDAALATVIESMCRYGGRCLPVVDSQSQVMGVITVFDVLLRVLEADQSLAWKGKPPQTIPVLV